MKVDRYNLEIANYFDHSVEIDLKTPRRSDTILLEAKERRVIPGRFNQRNLDKVVAICHYNDKAYELDKKLLSTHKSKRLDSLNHEFDIKERQVLEDFDIILKEGSLQEKNRLIERNQIYINLDPKLKVYQAEIKQKNISDYTDLEKTILIERFDAQGVDSIYVRMKDNANEQLSDVVATAILYTADRLSKDKEQKVIQTLQIEENYNSSIAKLSLLNNDIRFASTNTYKASEFSQEENAMQSIAPSILLSAFAVSNGNQLNDFWAFSHDNVYRRGEDDKLELSNGLINRTLGASIHFPLYREFYYSDNVYSRIYGGFSFSNISFSLQEDVEFSDSFFSQRPSNESEPVLETPLIFEQQQFTGEILHKAYLLKFLTIDLFAGYMMQQGGINFNQTTVSGGFQWAGGYEKITERAYSPYYGWRLGIGTNTFHGGAWIFIGMRYFRVNHENTSEFELRSNNQPVDFTSDKKFISHFRIGASIGF